ncbi:GGDEF domain-containing protein [Methylobacterium sp. J-067]|uniref:GGDEF domain-containing protein n=1 Tax=Methylobacterium sp. J-067 TaxID=2836648 RepID=UPI001FB9CBAF|nr:diguanylate cyclase [Methylobacterium sp. J-067]MCJ2025752.1 diguanylate cyclase [Methylobacterium sp. J-067]
MQIVVVDSSQVVLRVIGSLLEARGHTVHEFTESDAALAFLTDVPEVRVLITSLEVRPMNGLELCWAVRLLAEDRRPLHIITMSSANSVHNLAEALDSGADDFIEKPPRAEELHARLRAAERMAKLQEELIRLAETDGLTGLLNRRTFRERIDNSIARGITGRPPSLIVVDIDHFKRINDVHGHDVGDEAIRAVAGLLNETGTVGRLGGEEFGIFLPERDLDSALFHAEGLRVRVRALRIACGDGTIGLTCSFGVSTWAETDTVPALIKRADVALYEAKAAGRNRVMTETRRSGFVAMTRPNVS